MMLGFAPVSSGPIGAVPTVVPAAIRPPSISSGGALGFAAMSSGPVSAVPTVPPPDVVPIAAEVVEAASATDAADAVVQPQIIVSLPGGGYRAPLHDLVVGYGYGVLPALWGEAHGTVGQAPPTELDELEMLLLLLAA